MKERVFLVICRIARFIFILFIRNIQSAYIFTNSSFLLRVLKWLHTVEVVEEEVEEEEEEKET